MVAVGVQISCKSKPGVTEQNSLPGFLDSLAVLDQKLGTPDGDDWLASHAEPGQTLEKYIASNPPRPNQTRRYFYLQPLGNFPGWQLEVIKNLGEYLSYFYGLPVKITPVVTDPWYPVELERWTADGRKQVLTSYILDSILLPHLPADAAICMGITNRDLYTGADNNFVFGVGTFRQRIAVASMFRFMGEIEDSALCLQRIIKTSSHEAGHVLGMWHCTHAHCLMNGSNNVEELDKRPFHLCSICSKKAYWNLQIPFYNRLNNLHRFYTQHGLASEAEWVNKARQVLHIQ